MEISLGKNYSIVEDGFNRQSPVDCNVLKVIGLYLIMLFIASLVSNTRLLVLFATNRQLLTPINLVIFVLTIVNLTATLVELPLVTINAFMCRFVFGKYGCYFSAFFMYFTGCFSISTTVAISVLRYKIARYCLTTQPLKWKLTIYSLISCALVSFLFSVVPFLGWSNYTLEGSFISCCIEWKIKSLNVSSYNITMFILFFFMPCILLAFTNIRFIQIYTKSRNIFRECHTRVQLRKFISEERKLKLIGTILTMGFLISWTPYAIVALHCAFFNPNSIDPLLATVPGLFAKTSLLWSSLLYSITNKNIVKKKSKFKCTCQDASSSEQRSNVNRIDMEPLQV